MKRLDKLKRMWEENMLMGAILGAFIGQIVGFLFIWLVLDIEWDKSIGSGIPFAIICATLGYFLRFIPQLRKEIKEIFDKRMGQIIQFVALGTKNGYWEKHLEKLRETDLGDLKWVVAKFISYKLNKDFNNIGQIEIPKVSTTDYSELLGDLIKECSESIYFTCPFTPTGWFVNLRLVPCMNHSPCKDDQHTLDPDCPYVKPPYKGVIKDHLPEHIRSFCSSKVKDKRRIINIPKDKFNSLKKNSHCFKNFFNYYEDEDKAKKGKSRNIETDDKIKVKFVTLEDLDSSIKEEYKKGDYNVLDKKIVVKWDDTSSICKLIFDRSEIEKHLEIFKNIDASPYKKTEEMKDP